MPDKAAFVDELARVCAPGGRIIVVGAALLSLICLWPCLHRCLLLLHALDSSAPAAPTRPPHPQVTWCHRVLAPGEASLTEDEQSLLDRICEAYYLPAWCSVADYERLFAEQGMEGASDAPREGEASSGLAAALAALRRPLPSASQSVHPCQLTTSPHPAHSRPTACADIRSTDWSEEVAPFWGEVIKSAFTAEGVSGLLKAGWSTIKVGGHAPSAGPLAVTPRGEPARTHAPLPTLLAAALHTPPLNTASQPTL